MKDHIITEKPGLLFYLRKEQQVGTFLSSLNIIQIESSSADEETKEFQE